MVDAAALLSVEDVRVEFGGIVALADLTFTIEEGQICALIGPNGAGKTTLFNCLSRLYEPSSGRITLSLPLRFKPEQTIRWRRPRASQPADHCHLNPSAEILKLDAVSDLPVDFLGIAVRPKSRRFRFR